MTRRVPRWRAAVSGALVAAVASVLFAEPTLAFAAVVPLLYLAYGYVTGVGDPDLAATRELSTRSPVPGETVSVTLRVENEGQSVLPDVRVVDGVPGELAVVDGSPRAAAALRPGDEVTVEYDVVARRGEFAFDDPRARVRDLSSTAVHTADVEGGGDESFDCRLALDDLPLPDRTIQFVGQRPTESGGSGVEFHATREYRPGDPLSRIDWRRLARTGDLTTVEFREQRSSTVVFVVDARRPCRVAPAPGLPSGLDLSCYAAERGLVALVDRGNRAGVAAVGSDGWVDPGSGRSVEARAADLFENLAGDSGRVGRADGGRPESSGDRARRSDGGDADLGELVRQLPRDAQVVLCSPALDDFPLRAIRTLLAYGHPVTVLSPDVTGGDSTGQRHAAIRRDARLFDLRETGARVVDWDVDDPMSIALGEALGRWVR